MSDNSKEKSKKGLKKGFEDEKNLIKKQLKFIEDDGRFERADKLFDEKQKRKTKKNINSRITISIPKHIIEMIDKLTIRSANMGLRKNRSNIVHIAVKCLNRTSDKKFENIAKEILE
jgi:hypothetical protein